MAESTGSPGRHHSLDVSYLLDRHQKQNVDKHSIIQGSLALVLAQAIAGCSYLLPAKKYHSTPSIKMPVSHFFHLPKGMAQFHPYNSKLAKITLSSFKSSSMTSYKNRRKGSLTAFLFCIVDFINAFRILCPSRSTCQKEGANPMLKTRIKWDRCHETVTVSAKNTALPTVLTF